MSLVHVVLIRPRKGLEDEARSLSARIVGLARELGAQGTFAGEQISTEPFSGGYTVGAAMTFQDPDSLDRYLHDHRHTQLAQKLGATTDAVVVVDLPSSPSRVPTNDDPQGATDS